MTNLSFASLNLCLQISTSLERNCLSNVLTCLWVNACHFYVALKNTQKFSIKSGPDKSLLLLHDPIYIIVIISYRQLIIIQSSGHILNQTCIFSPFWCSFLAFWNKIYLYRALFFRRCPLPCKMFSLFKYICIFWKEPMGIFRSQIFIQYSNIFTGHRASSEKKSPVEKFQIFLLGSFFLKMPTGSFFLKMPCKNIWILKNIWE